MNLGRVILLGSSVALALVPLSTTPAYAHGGGGGGGGGGSVTVTALAPNTTTPVAGSTGSIEVELSAAAPKAGSVVTLASSNSSVVSVPASVTVASGQTSGDFSYTAGQVSTSTAATVTATLGSSSASATLTVTPVSLFSLEIGPGDDVVGGATVTVEPDLSGPAPAGGAQISLTSSSPSLAPVPATAEIPAGDYLVAVSVTTAPVSAVTDVTFTATWNGATLSSQLELDPVDPPISVTFNPATTSGTSGSTGTVTLANPAPGISELAVGLTSSDPSAASVGAAYVEPGNTSATFAVTTTAVTTDTTVTITATTDGGSVSGTLALTPPPPPIPALQAISLSATSVTGGTSATGTASLNVAAPSGGALVQLVSSNTAAASVPSSVTVPAGATSATFTVTTKTVSSTTTVGIGGIYGPGFETDGATDSTAPGMATVLLGVTGRKGGSVLSPPPSGIDIEPFFFDATPEGIQNFIAIHPLEITLAGTLNEFEASVESGSLPPGFTISSGFGSDVAVSGSPTTQGLFAFVLEFTISGGPTFAQPYVWQITPPLEITQVNLPGGVVGEAYDGGLTGGGGTPPYTWLIDAGALPAGLSLNASTGAITGTPTTSGTSSFTVELIDSFGFAFFSPQTITISST
jgi:Putative Ig domain